MRTEAQPAPFSIDCDDEQLSDLARRLDQARWPDVVPGAGWQHGAALDYVQGLATYWRTDYDWRRQEAALNALPHFTTELDRQRVHFVHVRSSQPDALPLLLIHGWPGSFVEFLDLIALLTEPATGLAFDVVIASIPGFTFSGPTHEDGWTTQMLVRDEQQAPHVLRTSLAELAHCDSEPPARTLASGPKRQEPGGDRDFRNHGEQHSVRSRVDSSPHR